MNYDHIPVTKYHAWFSSMPISGCDCGFPEMLRVDACDGHFQLFIRLADEDTVPRLGPATVILGRDVLDNMA